MFKLWGGLAGIFALLAAMIVLGIFPEFSFGAMVFASLACCIYGIALPKTLGDGSIWWHRAWHIATAIGVTDILLGGGSGIWSFPFPIWLGVAIAGLCGVAVFQGKLNWLNRAFAIAMVIALVQLLITNGLGQSGVLAAACLGATICVGVILVTIYRYLELTRGDMWMSLPVLLAPIVGGGVAVEGMPVWWVIPVFGGWWLMLCVAVIIWAVVLSLKSSAEVKPFVPSGIIVLCVFAGLMFCTMYIHYQDGEYEVKRPGADAKGAELFAHEGCALCHTQMIRRLDGIDLQAEVNKNTNPDFEPRYTELGDIDAERNREGAAHVGLFPIGPDLSNLAEFVEQRLEYEDAISGELKHSAHIREWLALHLYHPQEKMLGHPESKCLRGVRFFRLEPSNGQKNALPVKTPAGMVLVPNARGEHLLNYLESLSRRERIVHQESSREVKSPDFINNPPFIDRSKLANQKATRLVEKGRTIYLNKCAICHGNDGRGDSVNYPPLAGSEWIIEKSDAELVDIILNGLSGKISVAGKTWDSKMLPPGVHSSKDIAELLTFLRQHFGKISRTYTDREIDNLRKNEKRL